MFIRAYLRASTKDQDANRAKDGVSTEFGPYCTLRSFVEYYTIIN